MTVAFRKENRKILLTQTNELLFRVLIVFVIYSSVLSILSFQLGALGEFIIVDLTFNVSRIIALLLISKLVKNENIKYALYVCFGIVGFLFSFITLRDYLGIFYGALIYCYITIIIISLQRKVAVIFTGIGVLTYLVLFYFYPYKNVDLDVAYYLSQIGFVMIYNHIVLKVMDYFKAYENKIYDQLDFIESQKESLVKSEERYRLVFDASQDGLWDYDYINGEVYYSDQALQLLKGENKEEPNFLDLHIETIAKEDLIYLRRMRQEILDGIRDKYSIEFKKRTDGQLFWLEEKVMVLRDENGSIKRIGGSISNITDKKLKDSRIHTLAYYDALTLLPNRSFFHDELNRIIEAKGVNDEFAIAIIDIDDFKHVNDILGHESGDEVLVNLANRFKALPENNLSFARLGGDEFGLLFFGHYEEETLRPILDQIVELITQKIDVNKNIVQLTSSIGIAFYPTDGTNKEELLKNTELALYETKSQGKKGYTFFNQNMADALSKKVLMGNHLKEAIDKNELCLHYQPLFDCNKRTLIGFEALIRWQSDIYGFVSPGDFIPLAEEIGAINDIGKWVYQEAGKFSNKINADGKKLIISINVSPLQVVDQFFIEEMMRITQNFGIVPENMCIEITETALMTSFDTASANIQKLSNLGFIIAIDDFGTGYSSLSYLKNLPVDIIKIDKTFVDYIETDETDLDFLKTIINLNKVLKMSIVAEGVETEGQFELLKENNCDIVQGYLLSKPLQEQKAYEFIEQFF